MKPVIETRNLSKWYGNVLGISDVTLTIEPGITGLLGPNGAGKSTFLNLISGQIKPKAGETYVFGRKIWNNTALYSSIGFCPEHDSFYEGISGREFISGLLSLQHFKKSEIFSRTSHALQTVGLEKDADRVIRSYSRGMRQRLKIAQAIAHDPRLLIFDEPLNGLDPLGRRAMIRLIKVFGSEGRTVIVSSHVLPEIEAMTKRIILIHQGKIFAQGDIHYIRDLIDTHPHIISIVCSDPRALAEELIGDEVVSKIHFSGEKTLKVETDNRDAFFSRLSDRIVKTGIDVDEITSPDDNLQAVFDYLVGK